MSDLYAKPGAQVFIHIPHIDSSYAMNCLKTLRSFLDVFEHFMDDFSEEWCIYQNKRITYREWHFNQNNIAECKNDYNDMADQIAYICINLRYREYDATNLASLSATINRLDNGNIPMTKDERAVCIHITQRLWLLLNTTELLEMTKYAVFMLGASYACIDSNRIVPTSIYTAPFRLCSNNVHLISPEERIPGIFWWQYISEKMLSAVSCTHQYLINAPCDYSKIDDQYSHKVQGICLKLHQKLILGSRASKMLEQRLQLRAYLEPFLYHPDIDLLLHYLNDPFIRYDFELMPLTQKEIKQVSIMQGLVCAGQLQASDGGEV